MAPINTKTADSENNTGTTLQSLLEPVLKPDKPFESETVQITAAESETRAVKQKYYRLPLNHKPKSAVERLGLAVNESGNDLVEYEWVGVSARHEGTLMHEIICRMANGSFINQASAKKRWYNQLLSFGLHPQQIKKSIAKIKSTVDHMTHDARARWILDNTHSDPKNEWSISAVVNGRLENIIIDRTFKDEHGVRWIIDYKTSTHEGANVQAFLDSEFERYRPQLENYAAILRLSELNPIKLGLYFPLLKAWREWDYVG